MQCPICNNKTKKSYEKYTQIHTIDCPRCGEFKIENRPKKRLEGGEEYDKRVKSLLSHKSAQKYLRDKGSYLTVDDALLTSIDKSLKKGIEYLPGVKEQVDNFIIYLGMKLDNKIWDLIDFKTLGEIGGIAGSLIDRDASLLDFIVRSLEKNEIISKTNSCIGLTLEGWQYFEELQSNKANSKKAFMAMAFNSFSLQELFPILRDEVKNSGYKLFHVADNDEQTAGNISNKIAVEIRNSKFLVVDLTDNNSGAYWEAGFAHGLGKFVFYVCKKGVSTHFDVNQHNTIFWEEGKIQEAAEKLKFAIRNTLADEALMED